MKYLIFVLLSLNLFAVDATLKISKDVEQRTRISLVDASVSKNKKFFDILQADIKISGHFLYDGIHHAGELENNFIPANLKGREYVLKYMLQSQGVSRLTVRLLKTSDNTEVFRKSYTAPSRDKTPFLAHRAIADINKVLQYPDISWINRYVLFSRYTTPKRSEIVLADYTFSYQKPIIRGGLNLFPKWANKDQSSFYYSAYGGLVPTLYKLNIYTGKKEKIISSEGMLVCSDVSKNGSKLLLTMAFDGQADIYELNVASRNKTRITKFQGIDVNGKYVDNENNIIFVSNRLGYANVFKRAIHVSGLSQIVNHGRNNNACDGFGKKIVYSSRESKNSFGKNTFNIYLASSNGSNTQPLTSAGMNQFPRFSWDGSVVLYIRHTNIGSSIGYINLRSKKSLLFPLAGRKIQSIDW